MSEAIICEAARPRAGCVACRSGEAAFDFTMAFQPIVDAVERRIDGHEALVRGMEGQGAGMVLAQVNDANRYAFDQACRTRAIGLAARLGLQGRLNINFLPNAVYEPRACIRATLQAAEQARFDPRRLTFEIVESEAVADPAHLRAIIAEYRRQGFSIALDDFGTQYSNLLRLVSVQPDIIKLDRQLILGCEADQFRRDVIEGLARLCVQAGVKVVAEGIETVEQAQALRGCGIRFFQGFLFGRPRFEGVVGETEIGWDEAELGWDDRAARLGKPGERIGY